MTERRKSSLGGGSTSAAVQPAAELGRALKSARGRRVATAGTRTKRPDTGLAGGSTTTTVHPAAELGRAFKSASAAVRRLRSRERRHAGELRDAQYTLLFGLREQEALPSSELAHLAALSPAAATELLDGLAKEGLVQRARSERDRRVVLVSLTERGRALVEERRAIFEPRWRDAFAEFSDEELRTAITVLERMAELFDELAED